jgi:hypothetical protein
VEQVDRLRDEGLAVRDDYDDGAGGGERDRVGAGTRIDGRDVLHPRTTASVSSPGYVCESPSNAASLALASSVDPASFSPPSGGTQPSFDASGT